MADATEHVVYRHTIDPYIIPVSPYIMTSDTSYVDTGAIVDVDNYFYVIRAVNGCGESNDSKRVGKFRQMLP